jgi:hypothetical protein
MSHLRLIQGEGESPWKERELPENVVPIAPQMPELVAQTYAATVRTECRRCGTVMLNAPLVPLCPACQPHIIEWMLEAVRSLKTT